MSTPRQERRKQPRMALSVPVRVQSIGGSGPWEEMTTSTETGFGGLSFPLKRQLSVGQIVHLSAPLPKSFRRYDLIDPSYHVYAVVRHVCVMKGEMRVGVFFLGKTPPKGYQEHPGGVFLMSSDTAPRQRIQERRQHARLDVFVNLKLWRSDAAAGAVQEEQTVAENLSKRGARVLTSLPVSKGEVLYILELGGSFKTRVEVKNLFIGKDNVPRLNLCFLDEDAPDRLIAS